MNKTTKILFGLGFFVLLSIAFIGGWIVKGSYEHGSISEPMRLNGFKFIKPLLVCDISSNKTFPELDTLKNKLENFIKKEETANNITSASIYFQDFSTDGRIDINKDEKFRSASMGKVPIIIAFFRMAESDPQILYQTVKYSDGPDFNAGQEIKPKQSAEKGKTYTVEDLLEKMIKYSDNNSTYLLLSLINSDKLRSLFQDLQVPFPIDISHPENFDFITSRDMSYFFRVLYNSTYLTNDLSEKAMRILSDTDFKDGLRAGVPGDIEVAHKFGIDSFESGGNSVETEHELHDCGVVYQPTHPYLLCIMTKSHSDVQTIENVIKNISDIVYKHVNSYSK